jgi:hypothetical protein
VTAPIEPAPGATATEPTAQSEPAPGAPAEPAAQPAQSAEDIASLPEWAQKQIRDLRGEATKARTAAKQTAAQEARQQTLAEVAKALGIGQEGKPVSAEDLAGQIEQAQSSAWVSAVELQVYRAAGSLGADAEALLDSNFFRDSLDDLVDEDPRSAEFAEALKTKVQAALEAKPDKYRPAGTAAPAGPRPDPSQGARGAGPTIDGRIAEAQAKGDWRTVITLQNEKLAKLTS